jgi:predicted component of type VI protein secretion system
LPGGLPTMPWIIISANGEEIDRRELSGSLVVGRSPECDVAVRDLLLSRTHCRIEPVGNGWKVVDLNSRNGTRVGWQGVQTHALRDGDHLRMGRTRIVFHTGEFEPAPQRIVRVNRIIRPADPHEALTGTVTDFILVEDEESPVDEIHFGDRPYPQPRPFDPVPGEAPGDTLQNEQPSSPWCVSDSSSDAASTAMVIRPRVVMRALPRFPDHPVYREIRRRADHDEDLSLQADPRLLAWESPSAAPRTRGQELASSTGLIIALVAGTAIVLTSIWMLTLGA